jgi:exo-beta-1,3-glucanase (GH17 family)
MKGTIALWMALCILLNGCTMAAPDPDLEATVQTAVQQTIAAPTLQAVRATPTLEDNLKTLQEKLSSLCWVAYSPTHFDPDKGDYPSETDIQEDLRILYNAGFRGLVTYGAASPGQQIPKLAKEVGFEGVIMGVWSPTSAEEIANAKDAAAYVDGYNVGNEGLFFSRYDFNALKAAMNDVRSATQRPVATTEVLGSYFSDANLRELGDWVFPTAHPYWNGVKTPQPAATWTQQQFVALSGLYTTTSKLVVFKEVGLPTAGEPQVSEAGQADYYGLLHGTNVRFVHFEAFVEPYWGLYRSDRSPKPAVSYVCAQSILYSP